MLIEELVLLICGYEDTSDRVRLYFEEQKPLPSVERLPRQLVGVDQRTDRR